MLETLGLVEARFSTPHARIRAKRRVGTKSVLAWIVRRITDCQQLDGVIVVTSDAPENCFVSQFTPPDVPVFVSRQADALGAMASALGEYPCASVVRMSAERPFVDPALIDRLVCAARRAEDCDYATYASRDGRPAIFSPIGVFAEWFRTETLLAAAREVQSAADREDPTRYFSSSPERFRTRLLPAPAQIDRDDVRLTVDVEEDWENALAIIEALGAEEFDWQRIADLLDHQPALRRRMAVLNRVYAGS